MVIPHEEYNKLPPKLSKVSFEIIDDEELGNGTYSREIGQVWLWRKPESFLANRLENYPVAYRPLENYFKPDLIQNPSDGACIVTKDGGRITIELSAKILTRFSRPDPWQMFTCWGVENIETVLKYSTADFSGQKDVTQLSFKLKEMNSMGYIQFYLKDGFSYRNLPNRILTLFVFRNFETYQTMAHPCMITVAPTHDQTYVYLIPGQHLQIITPDCCKVELCEKSEGFALFGQHFVKVNGSNVSCSYVRCKEPYVTQEPIIINCKKHQKAVLIPTVENGYIRVFNPQKSFAAYCYNATGISVKFFDKTNEMWKCNRQVDLTNLDGEVKIASRNTFRYLIQRNLLNWEVQCL